MKVCIDTNVLLRLFGNRSPFIRITQALVTGSIQIVVSNDILLEYEEIVTARSGADRWREIEELFGNLAAFYGNVLRVDPHFQFHVIASDFDDNKFVDCAIAAQADFVVTSDKAFGAFRSAGYKPLPITPEEFIERLQAEQSSPPPEQEPGPRRGPPR
jgi:putative PIN family toxin of toxin-antitoxin system